MKTILNNRIIQHVAFWCFYVLIYTANYEQNGKYAVELLVTMMLIPFHLLFTYTQLYVLIPFFLMKRKIVMYVLFTILLLKITNIFSSVVYFYYVCPLKYNAILPDVKWTRFLAFDLSNFKSVFSLCMICGIAVSIKLLKKWFYEKDRNQQIEKEKLNMELEMLKAQVHPHFLFNTLNNLYSLTLTQSDKAPMAVTHLSDLLRYMLYECNKNEVPLDKEIEVLRKYIELEKLRYGNRIDISFSASGSIKNNLIAPLILFPFVENSFKHGISEQLDQCWVNLHLHAKGNEFSFNLSNSLSGYASKTGAGGIGLQNIKKRLELLYAGKYNLTINEEGEMYVVKLQMQLNPAVETAIETSTPVIYQTAAAV